MNEAPAALEVSELTAGYGRYDVVRNASFTVAVGELVALLGPNGAGKTTTLAAITGLLKQRRGRVCIAGTDVSHMRSHEIGRGYAAIVPEGRRLFLDQSVRDNLIIGAYRLRKEPERVAALLASVYALFPVLEDASERPASNLSGGQQQMAAIGRMLMNDPRVLVLDEPSLGLAPQAVQIVAEALAKLKKQGRSILLVEQRVDIALELCDRFYVLSAGEIVLEERPSGGAGDQRAVVDAFLG